MGAIEKTSFARALYERIFDQFDFHYLIDDVRKIYRDYGTLGV